MRKPGQFPVISTNIPVLLLILFSAVSSFSQPPGLTPKDPEYYLPNEEMVVTHEFFLKDSSYREKFLLQKGGSVFTQLDDVKNKDYFRLRDKSLYYSDDTGGDMVMCLKYPLFKGKKWREGNTINVEVIATNETVQVGMHSFYNCLKILRTYPEDVVAEDPEESQPVLEIYAPGRWLVAKTGYPVLRPVQVQVNIEKYSGQFKTYNSISEKRNLKENVLRLDTVISPGSKKELNQ